MKQLTQTPNSHIVELTKGEMELLRELGQKAPGWADEMPPSDGLYGNLDDALRVVAAWIDMRFYADEMLKYLHSILEMLEGKIDE